VCPSPAKATDVDGIVSHNKTGGNAGARVPVAKCTGKTRGTVLTQDSAHERSTKCGTHDANMGTAGDGIAPNRKCYSASRTCRVAHKSVYSARNSCFVLKAINAHSNPATEGAAESITLETPLTAVSNIPPQ